MTEIDLYSEENKPRAMEWGKLYYIRLDGPRKADEAVTAWLAVDQYGYCELRDWYYLGLRDPHRPYRLSDDEERNLYDAEKAVWTWLEEWELVHLRPIGPEDSEYFATSKLTGDPNDDRR